MCYSRPIVYDIVDNNYLYLKRLSVPALFHSWKVAYFLVLKNKRLVDESTSI